MIKWIGFGCIASSHRDEITRVTNKLEVTNF